MDSYKDVQPKFGQRCRRIVLEVFYELIHNIHHWIKTKSKTVTDILKLYLVGFYMPDIIN
jgi:hypothetical protein